MNTLLPIIEQMHNAADDRARADILLRCPDGVMLKYADVFRDACRRAAFDPGETLVHYREAALMAVRDANGLLPPAIAGPLEELRQAMARFAAGGRPQEPPAADTDL
ncbi:hypothetical protein [Nitratireductor indicus]|nr:hypothetical protein [Nitratireductor indicus]SFQ10307.1 hypothetical protein SAMN05216176_101355 [Nitratireductor indicus]